MREQNYLIQLDGLRLFAVSCVMFAHWIEYPFLKQFNIDIASLGVNMFFVLSGFLITQILIHAKQTNAGKQSNFFTLRQFYIRRFLRIFPIYYLVIFLGILFNIPTARENFLWYITYTTNFYWGYFYGYCHPYDHLWSLGVEEQFYLFFPLFILLIPNRHLLKAFVLITILAVVSRAIPFRFINSYSDIYHVTYSLTPCCFDCFGAGAILAYLKIYQPHYLRNLLQKKWLFIPFLFIFFLLPVFKNHTPVYIANIFMSRSSSAVFSFWLIGVASFNQTTGIAKRFLENPRVIYLGKISYGLYVYHNFIKTVFTMLHIPVYHFTFSYLVYGIIYFAVTLGLSMLSWHFLEKPINNLKNRFDYTGHNRVLKAT